MNTFKPTVCALALIAAAAIAGCSTNKPDPVYAEVPGASSAVVPAEAASKTTSPAKQSEPVVTVTKPTETAQPKPTETKPAETKPELIVTPDDTLTGSIVSVNDVGRFVVINFPLGRMPAVGAKLLVYRQGMKVGELKVTGPQKDDHTIADITTGDCRPKDEVRDR